MKLFSLLTILLLFQLNHLTAQFESEPNESFGQATNIGLNSSNSGCIQGQLNPSYDDDFYVVNIQQTGIYTVCISNVPSNIRVEMDIYDSDQSTKLNDDVGNTGESYCLDIRKCDAGMVYIKLEDYSGSDESTEYYNLCVDYVETDPFECNESQQTASLIPLNTPQFATIYPSGDKDIMAVTPNGSGLLLVEVANVPSDIDIDVIIKDINGVPLFSNDDTYYGETNYASYKVCESATYFIEIADGTLGSNNQANPEQYKLTAFFYSDTLECDDNFAGATPINIGDCHSAYILEPGDKDYFVLNLEQASNIEFNFTEVPSNAVSMQWSILNASGNSVVTSDCFPISLSNVTWITYLEVGTYYIIAQDCGNNDASPSEHYEFCINTTNSTSVDELTTRDVRIFPNPAKDYITIKVPPQSALVELYDVQGKLVYQQAGLNRDEYKFDLIAIHPGVYFLMVRTDNGKVCEKLIVE